MGDVEINSQPSCLTEDWNLSYLHAGCALQALNDLCTTFRKYTKQVTTRKKSKLDGLLPKQNEIRFNSRNKESGWAIIDILNHRKYFLPMEFSQDLGNGVIIGICFCTIMQPPHNRGIQMKLKELHLRRLWWLQIEKTPLVPWFI